MLGPALVSWVALAVGLLSLALGVRIAFGWRDWKIVPLLGGLVALCTSPMLDILSLNGILSDADLHRLVVYRSLVVAMVVLTAVLALHRLMEQERGLRRAAARSDVLARSNVKLASELEKRRKAERAAMEAQTRLNTILDNTPAIIFIKDLTGRYLYLNRSRAYPQEAAIVAEFVGSKDVEVFPSEIAAKLRASDAETVEKGEPTEAEHTILGPRGARTYVVAKFPLRDEVGGIYAVAGVATDITKHAETTITIRQIFEFSPALMCVIGANGRFVTVNPAFTRVLGYPESELVGQHYKDLVHPEDRAATRAEAFRVQSGGPDAAGFENRCRTRDGRYRVLSWHTIYVRSEGRSYVAATDVTEKAQQRETLQRIYQLAPVAMATFDWNGRIAAVNPLLPRLLGFTADEMVGRSGLAFLHPDDVARFRSQGHNLSTRPGALSAFEGRVLCKERGYRTLSWDVVSAPEERAFYAVARDVTDLRAKEQQMAKRREEMAHMLRLQTVGELAAEMSHELNQPLGAIVNFARGLTTRIRAGTIAQDDVTEIVEKIAAQALRGGDLIRRILAFARRAEIEPEDHCLNDIVRDTVALFGSGGKRETSIVLSLDDTLPAIRMDRAQMQQVVYNLIRNALEAVDDRRDCRVVVRTVRNGASEIELVVSDNGPGVPPSDNERIFEAFYTTRPGGVGLGLAISRSIVQAHEGRLWVESAPEEGTTFHVALPLTPYEQQIQAPSDSPNCESPV